MREIKFRVWHKKQKVMEFFGPARGLCDEYYELYFKPDFSQDEKIKYPGDTTEEDLIVMQYTGLKDKNGEEIYEGDIVKTFTMTGGKFQEDEGLQEIHWWKGSFCRGIKDRQGLPLWWLDENTQKFEVIGNIYENPELLKKEG